MDEKYDLKWHTITDHLQLMFKDLYKEGKHSDVTLISDDQSLFKAHKIVLSACSPVFKKIIENNASQNPLIYLRGIQSYEIESILQFMYLGEARLFYERMGEFIKVSKDLEVKEIINSMEIKNEEEDVTEETAMEGEENEPKQTSETEIRQRQPRKQISSDVKFTDCPECGKVFSEKNSMMRHYRCKHEGIKFPCSQCDYQFTQLVHLQRHIQSKHECIKYPCNQCDFSATHKSSLQTHIQSKHEGIKFPCNHCNYQATQQSSLKRHIQSIHASQNKLSRNRT